MTGAARYINDRLGFALAGLLGIALLAALAGYAQAGPLDPPAGSSPVATDGVRLPGTPISSVPVVISAPGHYYLTRNLSVTSGTAIQVDVADVSIDLGGFTLSGNELPTRGIDVTPGGSTRFSVRNGTIADFGVGILAANEDNRVQGVALVSNDNAITIGAGGVITDCLISGNVIGVLVIGNFVELRRCNINANGEHGVLVTGGIFSGLIEETSFVANNTQGLSHGNGLYLEGARATVRDSAFSDNLVRDIFFNGSESIVFDNVLACPSSTGGTFGAVNFVPVNSADPHTNRSHKVSAC